MLISSEQNDPHQIPRNGCFVWFFQTIRFANVIAVWKWSYKLIYMLVFPQYFSLNVHHLNYSIYIWKCCSQTKFLNKKIIMKCLAIKIIAWRFLQLPIQKSWHSFLYYTSMFIPYVIIFFIAHWVFSKFYFFKHGNLVDLALSNSLYLVIGW